MVLSSKLCQEAGTANYQDAAPIKASSSSSSSNGTEASKYNPKHSDSSNTVKQVSFGSMKNKFCCAIHGIANHPTEKCNKYKVLLNQNSSANLLPSSTKSPTVADKTGAQKLKSTLYLRHMSATFVAYTI
ncbi:hypothetical protein G6F60_014093 [Rhizopus arrhizus]|nr:hypothetical protein G6F61_013962 [Rhizopus arrhizus]KAG1387487.1 hypothetical protein G6F60_014093 [Rhizopus arrhizus]